MDDAFWIKVRTQFESATVRSVPGASLMRRAAVAAVFRCRGGAMEVLLVKRAEYEGDRWSGHMAFPGGKQEETDASLVHTAQREALEEVGLDLSTHGEELGRGPQIMAKARGKVIPMVIDPVAFRLLGDVDVALDAADGEVQEALWIPWEFFQDPSNRTTYKRPVAGVTVPFPCFDYEGRIVWGLTYRMICNFVDILGG